MALQTALYHANTVFLFTRTDIITTIVPIGLFGIGTAPVSSVNTTRHVVESIGWLWLHLLQFNIANQTRDVEEDKLNKPWRPLAADRITMENAHRLHSFISLLCIAGSFAYSNLLFAVSLSFTAGVSFYHNSNAHGHWVMKSLMNAFGLTCLGLGTTIMAGFDRTSIDSTSKLALILTAAIIATTTHTQDFRDVDGDRLIGRKTIPIVIPSASRYTPIIALCAWTICLSQVWILDHIFQAILTILAIVTGYRFFYLRTPKADRHSFLLYNIWLSMTLCIPGYYRLCQY